MTKIKSLADLKKIKAEVEQKVKLREISENPEQVIQVKVAMATCGIAAGAKDTLQQFITGLDKKGIDAIVTQTGCMGYCYAEPTVEITIPNREPAVFGFVNAPKVEEIINDFIVKGEMIDGIIPVTYKTIHD